MVSFKTQGAYTQLEVQSILRDLDTLNSLPNAQALSKAVSETFLLIHQKRTRKY